VSITHRVLIFGGRSFGDVHRFRVALDTFRSKHIGPDDKWCIIQGKANGADRLAENYAALEGIPCISVAANWLVYNRGAGPIRNQWMLDFCAPTYAIAFPGGKGTADMTRRVQDAGITLWVPYES